jgi:hypothetical protein
VQIPLIAQYCQMVLIWECWMLFFSPSWLVDCLCFPIFSCLLGARSGEWHRSITQVPAERDLWQQVRGLWVDHLRQAARHGDQPQEIFSLKCVVATSLDQFSLMFQTTGWGVE